MTPPKLSILVRTYNVENYITDCLSGILNQKTTFSLEIIVSDDASTDLTLSIVDSFAAVHPGVFRVLRNPTNEGLVKNFMRAFRSATGEYVAICDGDDFWTDPLKIQRQIDFLETHSDYSCSSHRVMVKKEPSGILEGPIPNEIKSQYNTYDLLDACFPHSSSILFRRKLISEFPFFFSDIFTDDWCVTILNSLYGDVKMFPETMSVYRFTTKGNWTSKGSSFHFGNAAHLLSYLRDYLPEKYRSTVTKYLLINTLWCGTHSLSEGDFARARHCLWNLLRPQTLFVLNQRQVVSFAVRLLFPKSYLKLKSFRNVLWNSRT